MDIIIHTVEIMDVIIGYSDLTMWNHLASVDTIVQAFVRTSWHHFIEQPDHLFVVRVIHYTLPDRQYARCRRRVLCHRGIEPRYQVLFFDFGDTHENEAENEDENQESENEDESDSEVDPWSK